MRKILSLLSAVLFAGTMMALDAEVIIHASSGDYYAKTNNWENGTQYDQVVIDEHITANRIGTSNNGKYYSDWRFYTNGSENGSFSVDAVEGYELQTVKITYSKGNSGALYIGDEEVTSNTAIEVSGRQVVFTCKNTNAATNGQAKVTRISVTYQESQGGDVEPQPQPGMKTIYCKMEHAWWKDGDAVIGIYTWNDLGEAKAVWPGERMAPVEGVADVWSFDLDTTVYHKCIFTRLNPNDCEDNSGCSYDWGAKTTDLLIPTDGKNLFTITNESACWGGEECSCIGVWSVYGEGGGVDPQPQPVLANGFYLIGQNGWTVAALSADLKFEPTEANPSEYILNATLVEGQGIKVVKVENDALVAWYPDGEGNEYLVDEAHAGTRDIYFQETYKQDWAAFGGFIWMGANEHTGVTNIDAAKAVKVLYNGQVVILRGENKYTVVGQIVK